MPAGVAHPVLGPLTFVAIKLAGYSLWCRIIIPVAQRRLPWMAIGILRTFLGITVGTGALFLAGFIFTSTMGSEREGMVWCYAAILPFIRFGEWWLIFATCTTMPLKAQLWRSAVSIPMSYLLDVPAIYGLITVTGFWIC